MIFLNHKKSQCGIYELGKRIYGLLDKNVLPIDYFEIGSVAEYDQIIEENKPDFVIYNYFQYTMPFLNGDVVRKHKMKHLAIIHDALNPTDIPIMEGVFDAWIIHDDTNPIQSVKKFRTVRPIRRFERTTDIDLNNISIGTHGFNCSAWKMFDVIIQIIQNTFDDVTINMNITEATYGHPGQLNPIESWKKMIYKPNVRLNITHEYFPTEEELINFLSKNTMNIYFYRDGGFPYFGVAASADLAVSAQSSLAVNSTYMYRHFHSHLGFYEQTNNLRTFLNNQDKVKEVYKLWSPERITSDYKNMIESV